LVTFLASKAFIELQFSINVVYIMLSKYFNALFIMLAVHYLLKRKNVDNKNSSPINKNKINILLFSMVVIGCILIKLYMEDLFLFFGRNGGQSFFKEFTFYGIIVWVVALALDIELYSGLYWIR